MIVAEGLRIMKRTSPNDLCVEVICLPEMIAAQKALLRNAGLLAYRAKFESWKVVGSNAKLAYSTHGLFRFFGKFPPLIPRKLIEDYTVKGQLVADPMCGSGTTALEALSLERRVAVNDISPLSLLLVRVKTKHVPLLESGKAFARVSARYLKAKAPKEFILPELKDPYHWFERDTLVSLSKIKDAIDQEPAGPLRDLLKVAFLSTVRRVSKATTQQGRLFLDVTTAEKDAWPTFETRFHKYARSVAELEAYNREEDLTITSKDIRVLDYGQNSPQLIIMHPPYFNNYKYSSINTLELAWMGVSRKAIREVELREAFKVGKVEKVVEYVQDVIAAVRSQAAVIPKGGVIALMMGDTIIREKYVNATRMVLEGIAKETPMLVLTKVVLRVPQHTEASWVASQRRKAKSIGVTLNDFILIFKKR